MFEKIVICPVCKSELKCGVMQGTEDEPIFRCTYCGTYAMSYEVYEDHFASPHPQMNTTNIAAYLNSHKREKAIPCICEYENSRHKKYCCIAMQSISK